ncbi:DUF1963 domain-containing protein [Streptomyces cucumeris]|uniref:DUF1963 domain-containing protein n=1 Tax=Streptomyces cucumeris TaxID=2962890 RepID=UPI003EBEC34A
MNYTSALSDRPELEGLLEVLPEEAQDAWLATLRPGLLLTTDEEAQGPVVGRKGGLPRLPEDEDWPVLDGYGPMTHIASIDCDALPVADLDIPLPKAGTLLIFRYNSCDYELATDPYMAGTVTEGNRLLPGAVVMHLPAGTPVSPRLAPEGLVVHDEEALRLRATIPTLPDSAHEAMRSLCLDADVSGDLAEAMETFEEEVLIDPDTSEHYPQIGGYAWSVQNGVGAELAWSLMGPDATEEQRDAEERRWVMLCSFFDAEDGILYYMVRREDLAEGDFKEVIAVYQC